MAITDSYLRPGKERPSLVSEVLKILEDGTTCTQFRRLMEHSLTHFETPGVSHGQLLNDDIGTEDNSRQFKAPTGQ